MRRLSLMLACIVASNSLAFTQTDTVRSTFAAKDTVVVTATRNEQSTLGTPMAVTVVPKMVLQTQRGFGMDEALTLVPGVLAQSRTGNTDVRIQVRGFGARGAGERSNAGTSRGVRFYQDGIPETEPDGRTSFDIINMTHASRVEVMRSNSSALWGNASGGVVFISTVPEQKSAFVDFGGSFGSFGYMKQQLLANTPLNGDGQLYLSLVNQHTDGWRIHSESDLTQATLGMLTSLSVRTKINTFVTGAWSEYNIPGALTPTQYATDPQQGQNDPAVYNPTYVVRDEFRNNKLGRIGTTIDHDFGGGHGLSATAYIQSKFLQRSERNTWRDFTRYHFGGNAVYRNTVAITETIANKLLIGTDIQYQDGAILFYNLDTNRSTNDRTVGRGLTLRDNKKEGAMNFGAFLQDEVNFGDFSVVAGLRYDAITYYAANFVNPTLDTSRVFTKVIPKLGLIYRASDLLHLYANLGGGIEVPAGNETDPPAVNGEDTLTALNPLLEPISSTTIEIGTKGAKNFGDGFVTSFTYDVAAFYISITNDIIPYRGGRFYQTAGQSSRMGFELGASVMTEPGLSLSASFTLMKTEYVDYVIDSGFIDATKQGITVSYNGNEIAGIPSMFATTRLRYDLPMLRGLFAELEMRMVGSYFVDDANLISVDSYSILDATIGGLFNLIKNSLDVNVVVRANNLTSTNYIASAWINPDNTSAGYAYIEPGLPLNIVGSLTFRVHL